MNSPIRVLIVDDHEIVREGLQTLLAEEPGIELVGLAASGAEALAIAREMQPDVVLMDIVMSPMNGIEATRQMRPISPASQVLVLTSFAEDRHVRDAIQAGAVGYLLKDVLKPELVRAIVDAARGRPTLHPEAQRHLIRQISEPETPSSAINLTQREISVLRLIAQGYSNKQIAAELHLTEGTVKGYVSTILGKLGVADRTQAALYAVKNGLASG
jgi:DNA-binding NarL/FixJ family response regulator